MLENQTKQAPKLVGLVNKKIDTVVMKLARVRLLPSPHKTSIIGKFKDSGGYVYNNPLHNDIDRGEPLEMYITRSMVIPANSWVIKNSVLYKATMAENEIGDVVIGTTNKSLWPRSFIKFNDSEVLGCMAIIDSIRENGVVARIGTEFILAFVSQNGSIQEVMVEYVSMLEGYFNQPRDESRLNLNEYKAKYGEGFLKLKNNGSITIHKVYTNPVVMEILKYMEKGAYDRTNTTLYSYVASLVNFKTP